MEHRASAADLVILNARLFRPRGSFDGAEPTALAVAGGVIAALGADRDVRRLAGRATEVVDAGGGLLTPGLDDAHSHVLAGGAWMSRLALHSAQDLGGIQRLVAAYAEGLPAGEWLIGGGWDYAMLPKRLPRREWLDVVVGDRPVILVAVDGHTSWVNSRALEVAGIDAGTPDPVNGVITRDRDSGEATGALLERATSLIHDTLPPRSALDYEGDLVAAQPALHRAGFTAVQDPRTLPPEVAGWTGVRDRDGLRLRARLALMLAPGQTQEQWRRTLDEHETLLREFRDDTWLDGGIVKCFVDGVVETGTAAMLAPYGDGELGAAAFDAEELTDRVLEADRRGWQVQCHAIGDRAVRMALDAYEAADRSGPWPGRLLRAGARPARRHRIEHLEVVDPVDVPRFADLGVIASVQPRHAEMAAEHGEEWREILGADRVAWGWPMAQILDGGGTVALGSDWPVAEFDPMATLRAAVVAHNLLHDPGHPAGSHALSVSQALVAYTEGSAVAAHAEHRRGALCPGYDADLTLFDRDLTGGHPDVLDEAGVRLTVVAGEIVHRSDQKG